MIQFWINEQLIYDKWIIKKLFSFLLLYNFLLVNSLYTVINEVCSMPHLCHCSPCAGGTRVA